MIDMKRREQELQQMYGSMSNEQLLAEFPIIRRFKAERSSEPYMVLQIRVLKQVCVRRGLVV